MDFLQRAADRFAFRPRRPGAQRGDGVEAVMDFLQRAADRLAFRLTPAERAGDRLRGLLGEGGRHPRIGEVVKFFLQRAQLLLDAAGVGERADVAQALDKLAHRRLEMGRGVAAGAGDHERFDGIEPRQHILLDARIAAVAGELRVQFGDGVADGGSTYVTYEMT